MTSPPPKVIITALPSGTKADTILANGRIMTVDAANSIGEAIAIKGNRIDVYLGPKSNMDLFRSTAMCRSGDVEVYLLQ